jgi:hypothetical protein
MLSQGAAAWRRGGWQAAHLRSRKEVLRLAANSAPPSTTASSASRWRSRERPPRASDRAACGEVRQSRAREKGTCNAHALATASAGLCGTMGRQRRADVQQMTEP